MANAERQEDAVRRWFTKYGQRVADMLGLSYSLPDIQVVSQEELNRITQKQGSIAAADGGTIYIGPKYDPKNEGAIVHEAVHYLQFNNGMEGTPSRWVEAMADAVRERLGLNDASRNDPDGWDPNTRSNRLAGLKPWQFQMVNDAMLSGDFNKQLLNDLASGRITKEEAFGNDGLWHGPGDATPGDPTGLPGSNEEGGWETTDPGGGGNGNDNEDGLTDRERERLQEQREASRQNTKSDFINAVREFGIPMTQNVQQLLAAAIEDKYDYARFLRYLRQTPEYRQTFRGIFDENGGLKMSEAQYLANKKQYEVMGTRYGVNMSDARIGWLFKNDVDPEEFADRAPAYSRLRENKPLYDAFRRELVQGGVAKPKDVESNKEMFRFIMGAGNQEWYDLWQDSATRYAANQAGLTFAQNRQSYTNLNQRIVERISGMGLTEEAMAEGFENVADQLLDTLPLSKIQGYGLTKKDIVTAQFGGKGSAAIRKKIQQIMDQDEAFHQDRARTGTYATEEGVSSLSGNKQKAQTY